MSERPTSRASGAAPWPALPGLDAALSALQAPARAQLALQAEALQRLNQPLTEALDRQRELAESMAAAAEQMKVVAEMVEGLARRHAEVAQLLQQSMEPQRRYTEWLSRLTGGDPS
jgi:chromosome segregation ATPase